MTAAERPPDPGESDREGPPQEFFDELAEAFRRQRPQGSTRWNFADAFGRLEARFGAGGDASDAKAARRDDVAPSGGQAPDGPPPGFAHRLFDRTVADRLQPWIEARAAAAAQRASEDALDDVLATAAAGFDATLEAFRFLAARVEALEDAAAARRDAVDGMAWLVPPPDLSGWAGPVAEWVATQRTDGDVLHGDCGDGTLAAALSATGARVRAAEPRGAVAWAAADRGLDVHVRSTEELLAAVGPGTLGAVVLADVVDRVGLDQLLALLATTTDRLAAGAPLVVVATAPGAAATGWAAVAHDLLPGKPLHPETWSLLLARSGYEDVGPLDGPVGAATYAVKGRRPR